MATGRLRIPPSAWRRLSQALFFLLFLVLFINTDYAGVDELNWAVNLLLSHRSLFGPGRHARRQDDHCPDAASLAYPRAYLGVRPFLLRLDLSGWVLVAYLLGSVSSGEALDLVVGHECLHVARGDGWRRPLERITAWICTLRSRFTYC